MYLNGLADSSVTVGFMRLIKHNKGEVVHDKWYKNQLTNFARSASAQLWAGISLPGGTPNQIEIGNGSPTAPKTGVDPSDSNLWAPITGTLKTCDFITTWLTYNSQYSVTYQQTEANGVWTEVGLKDAAGNLWSHVQVSDFFKDDTETVTVQWQINHLAI